MTIIRILIQLLPGECNKSLKNDIVEFSRFLSEISICDYFFVGQKASSIAIIKGNIRM